MFRRLVKEMLMDVEDDGVDVDFGESGATGAGKIEQAVNDLRRAEGLLGNFVE